MKLLFLFLYLFSFSVFANTALLIIDMQQDFIESGKNHNRPENIKKVENLISRQIEVINLAIKSDVPIVVAEFENHGRTKDVLLDVLDGYENLIFVKKRANSLFGDGRSRKRTLRFLDSHSVSNLVVLGANGNACVKMSVLGASVCGLDVLVDNKSVADFNYSSFIYPFYFSRNTPIRGLDQTSSLEEISKKFEKEKLYRHKCSHLIRRFSKQVVNSLWFGFLN